MLGRCRLNFWVILLAAFLMAGLVLAAAMLWVGANAILNGRGRELTINAASLRRAFRSIYDGTLRESLPDDFRALLAKLGMHAPRKPATDRSGSLAVN